MVMTARDTVDMMVEKEKLVKNMSIISVRNAGPVMKNSIFGEVV